MSRVIAMLVVVLGMLQVAVGQLTTNYWLGTENGAWTESQNWSLGVVPDANTVVAFDDPLAPNRTISVDQNTAVHQIHFLSTMTSSVTISGSGRLSMGAGETVRVDAGSAAHTINNDLTIPSRNLGDTGLINNSTGLLTLSGIFRRAAIPGPTMVFDGSGDIVAGGVANTVVYMELAPTFSGRVFTEADTSYRPIGHLEVQGGTLVHDGRLLSEGSELRVANGVLTGNGDIGWVSGNRTLDVDINAGGIVDPGRVGEVGALSFLNHDVNFNAGSMVRLDLTSPASHDRLLFAQTGSDTNHKVPDLVLDTDGVGVTLDLNLLPGFSGMLHDEFVILSGYDNLVGQFAGLPDGATFEENGVLFEIQYGQGETILTIIPEPATGGMLLLGLVLFGLRRFARR